MAQKQQEFGCTKKELDAEIETITSQQRILELRIQGIEDGILAPLQHLTDNLRKKIKATKPKIIRAMLQGRNVTGIVSHIEAEIEKAFAQSSVSKK